VIEVQGIRKRFGDTVVLDDVSLRVETGEVLGIVGPGGVGKSVLLKIVCALLEPDAGEVQVMGRPITRLRGMELAAVRAKMGVLFQNNALFDFMTVADNVAFPLRQRGELTEAEIARRVEERLSEVGLGHAQRLLPSELSGGMKKRASLARATIASAPVLLYDDPTAGLDPVTSSKIFLLVSGLHVPGETTTVVVSHDVDRMKKVCDRIALLYEGGVRWTGTVAEAEASDDPILRTFFRAGGRRRAP
jgi:phospholipid/cholesterol/gamma-HCH transport system ATP-binding protein